MRTDDFDFDLPPELIAQVPPTRREDARLLRLGRDDGAVTHLGLADLPGALRRGDLLVVNDTRVLPARLHCLRHTGGRVEVLLLEPRGAGGWSAMVRSGGSIQPGEELRLTDGEHPVEGAVHLRERLDARCWWVEPVGEAFDVLMERAGKMPLPPYIRRERRDARDEADRERYQTVFARAPGAVAAPTAGLHLTDALLETLRSGGVGVAHVTLHVGMGTFLPVSVLRLEDHEMHFERYVVPQATREAIERTRAGGGRVVAVGTTTVRTLEAAAGDDGLPAAGEGRTDLFILPGHRFRVVDGLLTNFHLPRSTLLCLVAAFAGREAVLAAYAGAVRERYRFYSYGDAMLVL